MHAALKKIMLTEARDKGSLLGGDIGEGPSTLLECLPVEKNLKMDLDQVEVAFSCSCRG